MGLWKAGGLQRWRAQLTVLLTAENARDSWNYTNGTAEIQSCAWPGFAYRNADCGNANNEQYNGTGHKRGKKGMFLGVWRYGHSGVISSLQIFEINCSVCTSSQNQRFQSWADLRRDRQLMEIN